MQDLFFTLSKLIPLFLFPFPFFLLLSVLILPAIRRPAIRLLYGAVLCGFIAFSTTATSEWMIRRVEEMHPPVAPAGIPDGTAVVVLSGMLQPMGRSNDGPAFDSATDRILAADELIRLGKTKLVLISGGTGLLGQRGESEAVQLQGWLWKRSPPSVRILAEPGSRNTAENAIQSAHLLIDGEKIRRILLITSAFHMHRSVLCFERAGFQVIPYPVDYRTMTEMPVPEGYVPSPDALLRSTLAIKEYLGLVAYHLKGYI